MSAHEAFQQDTLAELNRLNEEIQELRERIERVDSFKDKVRPEVYRKVRGEYQEQLEELVAQLEPLRAALSQSIEGLRLQLAELQAEMDERSAEMEELMLRHVAGELNEIEYGDRAEGIQAELERLGEEMAGVQEQIADLEELAEEAPEDAVVDEEDEEYDEAVESAVSQLDMAFEEEEEIPPGEPEPPAAVHAASYREAPFQEAEVEDYESSYEDGLPEPVAEVDDSVDEFDQAFLDELDDLPDLSDDLDDDGGATAIASPDQGASLAAQISSSETAAMESFGDEVDFEAAAMAVADTADEFDDLEELDEDELLAELDDLDDDLAGLPMDQGRGAGETVSAGMGYPVLIIEEGEPKGVAFRLDKGEVTIGRGPDNDIQLANDTSISRYHARVTHENNEYVVTDLDSSNGTLVNGQPVTRKVLNLYDKILIGQTLLSFAPEDAPSR